jgi:hypothetical protein
MGHDEPIGSQAWRPTEQIWRVEPAAQRIQQGGDVAPARFDLVERPIGLHTVLEVGEKRTLLVA